MRKAILLSLFVLAAATAWGQSPLFYAYGNIQSRTVVSANTYNVTINNFNGGYREYPNANYEPTDITTTNFVVWAGCVRFTVTQVVSTSPLVLRVTDAIPSGGLDGTDLVGYRVLVLQEAMAGTYRIGAFGNVADGNAGSQAGVGPFDMACVQNYYRAQQAAAIAAGFTVSVSGRISGDGTVGAPLDIARQGATTNQVLRFNGTTWAPSNESTGINKLSNDTTTINVAANGEMVLNTTPTIAPRVYVPVVGKVAYQMNVRSNALDSSHIKDKSVRLQELNISGATNGQVPKWNSTTQLWEPSNDITGGGVTIDSVSTRATNLGLEVKVNNTMSAPLLLPLVSLAQSGATTGQVPKWNGTAWVPAADATGGGGSVFDTYNTNDTLTQNRRVRGQNNRLSFWDGLQFQIGDTASVKTYANNTGTGSATPKLNIVDNATSYDNVNPLVNFKTKADFGILWEHNTKDIDSTALPMMLSYGLARNIQPGINDFSYTLGYNKAANGNRKDLTKPSFGTSWEQKYEISQHGNCIEYYNTVDAVNGATSRMWYYIANRDSLYNASSFWEARNYEWRTIGGATAMSLLAPRTTAQSTLLGLYPGPNTSGPVRLDFYSAGDNSNVIRMARPTGLTGAGNMDNQLSYSTRDSKGITMIGGQTGWVGMNTDRVYMNPAGGRSSIVRNGVYFTLHIGSTNTIWPTNIGTVLQVNGSVQAQDEFPLSGSGNDLIRLKNVSSGDRAWGLSVDATGFGISKTATNGRFSMMLRDSAEATDYNLNIIGTKALWVPRGPTAQQPTAANGYYRYDTDLATARTVVGGEWTDVSTSNALHEKVTNITGNYTATLTDATLVTTNALTITLPTAARVGRYYNIVRRDTNAVIIDPEGSDTIQGNPTFTITSGGTTFISIKVQKISTNEWAVTGTN